MKLNEKIEVLKAKAIHKRQLSESYEEEGNFEKANTYLWESMAYIDCINILTDKKYAESMRDIFKDYIENK